MLHLSSHSAAGLGKSDPDCTTHNTCRLLPIHTHTLYMHTYSNMHKYAYIHIRPHELLYLYTGYGKKLRPGSVTSIYDALDPSLS